MENPEKQLIDDVHIDKKRENEKADVYNVINTLREYKQVINADQIARLLARLGQQDNIQFILGDVGIYLTDFNGEGLFTIMESCKFAKVKRFAVEKLASYLPEDTTAEQKEKCVESISSTFEKNKAKKALGM